MDADLVSGVTTAEELIRLPSGTHRYELVEGQLMVREPAGIEHCGVAANIVELLRSHVRSRQLGRVFTAEPGFILSRNPDTVRAPDAAFIRKERIEEAGLVMGYWEGAPDLAVEVVSPGDTHPEVEQKVFEWLDAGAQMVLVVNPWTRRVLQFTADRKMIALEEGDYVEGGDVVPGWMVAVDEIFE